MNVVNKQGTYPLTVIDNGVSFELAKEVYNYLLDINWYSNFYDPLHSTWNARTDTWDHEKKLPAAVRSPLAWDDQSLIDRAPIINRLWTEINNSLGNQYYIGGAVEGMNYMVGISPLASNTKPNGNPGTPNCAWRVYGSAKEPEFRARTKAIHRDSIDLDNDNFFTLVYFANLEWFPQCYGETLFHSNDSVTGDYTGKFEKDQDRNFPIGEVENVVAPMPGRIMLFDSRYLHQIKPTAIHAPEKLLAVVFRIAKFDEKSVDK